MKRRRKSGAIAAITLGLLALAGTLRQSKGAELPEGWLQDFGQAKERAKASGKPILAVFSAVWCGPCQRMIHEVYSKPAVKELLKNWVPVYVDEAKDAKTLEKFKIEGFPTFVILTPDGKEEDRFDGARSERAFIRVLKSHPDYMARMAKLGPKIPDDPKDAGFWKNLGDAYLLKDKYDEALEAYEKAAALDPADKVGVGDFIEFSKARPQGRDDLEAAQKRFGEFESKYPKSKYLAEVALYRGLIAADLGKKEEAIKLLEAGIKRFPESEVADDMRGAIEQLRSEK